ncbi:hypothetical protein [Neisseria bacilliformis]|uniref:hypothetical protein n=1 Tax=Neisseria bacilliformis TaxID=267212 RepID=UPI0028E5AACB|nr:hypothetical protein [Neisseria bacilliformis]
MPDILNFPAVVGHECPTCQKGRLKWWVKTHPTSRLRPSENAVPVQPKPVFQTASNPFKPV